MTTTNNHYSDDEDKYSVDSVYTTLKLRKISSYVTNCQICEWYGYPDEKILVEFEGIRSEEEEGFVDKFSEYDYGTKAGEKRTKHKHKYNPKLVQEYVDLALKTRNGG